jgi:hypothetical protein
MTELTAIGRRTIQGAHYSYPPSNCTVEVINRKGAGRGTKNVTPNAKSVTEINNSLPDNLNGPVLPYRMISFK